MSASTQHARVRGQPAAVEGGPHRLAGDRRRPEGRHLRSVPFHRRAPPRLGIDCAHRGRARPIGGTGVDVGAWLRGLGLGQYEQAFRDNDVDAEVLPELTADDLRSSGVASSATGAGCSPPSPPCGPAPRLRRPRRPSRRRRRAGRRRARARGRAAAAHGDVRRPGRLDRALARRLDPEDMREVLARLPERASRARSRASRATSPSSWATACWPTSAGPGRTRTTPSGRCGPGSRVADGGARGSPRQPGEPLAARVGIATGLVVVGDLVGEGAAREEAVVGETPNLAARLQALAEPGSVVIAERHAPAPRRACSSSRDLGAVRLKGFAEPVRAFRVVGASAGREPLRGPARRRRPHAAGRPRAGAGAAARPLASRPRTARARSCCSSGEPGIGKSRLVARAARAARGRAARRACATSARPTTRTARSGR